MKMTEHFYVQRPSSELANQEILSGGFQKQKSSILNASHHNFNANMSLNYALPARVTQEPAYRHIISTERSVRQRAATNRSVGPRLNKQAEADKLLERIDVLERENANLRKYNKRLMTQETATNESGEQKSGQKQFHFDSSTEVHSFYQDVFITDLNKEINMKNEQADHFKLKISGQAIIIDRLNKEIQHLNKVSNSS